MARISKADMAIRVTKVAELLLKGQKRADILRYATENNWGVSSRQIEHYITKATDEIKETATIDRELEVAKARARYEALYVSMLHAKDYRGAKAVNDSVMDRFGLTATEQEASDNKERKQPVLSSIPAELISPAFFDIYRDIVSGNHSEYLVKGGRGSTKSSFVSLAIVYLLVNNPEFNALALRNHTNTLRDSVFSQLTWAISMLGITEQFKTTVSPMEIEYLPTGQKIYFRGADKPEKLKGIIPKTGYVALLWLEELDQFRGEDAMRNIVQTAIRGGESAYRFLTYNPPKSANNWVNRYALVPKDGQYQHTSDFESVPPEWLGQPFIDEARHLERVNPKAYKHEYKGVVTGTGGQVFDNVEIREIADEEIESFGRVYHGLDFGFFPDPLSYGRMTYDAARMTIYIYGEYRSIKEKNEDAYNGIVEAGYNPAELLIADSAEPKSILDYRSYGAFIRGSEKGAGSVKYSIEWLAKRAKIVIDPRRAPMHAQEFTEYELEQDSHGEFYTSYPDKNNHAIDDVRYALNEIWRRGGQ